ncbi:hypothetical protein [Hyphomicrobium sp.]|uniref:hypothetical protein n=1 Tax=Hyphomicrobium sp. TaxID=82 RepID=UPI0025C033AF|nr:hypothetical protein [Hyphomicrobium sp.]MCC7251320.1 hypothetical protein [Hyphomicrobium sp.]
MVDFAAALSAVGVGLQVVKDLNSVKQQLDEATLKLKIGELSGALATAQIALAEAQTEIANQTNQIAKLEANFKQKFDLVEVRGRYYRKGSDGEPNGHALCSLCLEKGSIVVLVSLDEAGRPEGCPLCKSKFGRVPVYGWDVDREAKRRAELIESRDDGSE